MRDCCGCGCAWLLLLLALFLLLAALGYVTTPPPAAVHKHAEPLSEWNSTPEPAGK